MPVEINYNNICGKLKAVYQNYNFSTHKLRKLYSEPVYKRLVDYLASVIPHEVQRRSFDNVVPIIEDMPPKTFKALCRLQQSGQLEVLLLLIRVASKESIFA